MAERNKNMRELLIQAGISEINEHGATGFSIRRVADACGVSCAAPYKHFKDKREFIAAVIDYVNERWKERQQEVLASCGSSCRERLVQISVNYVRFLMEKPYYRSVLMLKDAEFDNIYHETKGQPFSCAKQLERDIFAQCDWDPETQRRKFQVVRALIFGTVFLFDTGELEYNEAAIKNLHYTINREFDLD